MAKQSSLDSFGEALMKQVRDKAILHVMMCLDGRMKGRDAKLIRQLKSARERDAEQLVTATVDFVLADLLTWVESDDQVGLTYQGDSAADASDGLHGELYGEDGWIALHSQYKEWPE